MKKLYVSFLLCLSVVSSSLACVDYSEDELYYNLFMQEIIDNQQYSPFLLTWETAYYSSEEKEKNENIEQWQSYLGLSYEDTEYLVFKAPKTAIDSLIAKKTFTDKRLSFATDLWTKKHRQALIYLSYAKYLEPYMIIVSDDKWSYDYDSNVYRDYSNNAGDLDYPEVINVLKRGWETEKDKELKQRYGYQMVRFAHYTHRYAEAVDFFERYVESICYCSAIHYYALNQCAGAERGLGNTDEANYMFFRVFTNTKNLKKNALNSIRFSSDADFKYFLKQAKSANETNDAYLLLGYMSFSNPVAMAEEIAKKSPDAIQAKVLVARAINELERKHNETSENNSMLLSKNSRYTALANDDDFFSQTLDFSLKMAKNKQVKEIDFWNLTTAYLYFMNKDFTAAKTYLAKVSEKNIKYKNQKELFAAYIYLCEQQSITPAVEKILFEKHKNLISIGSESFLTDVLANRYYLQKDYAKSFLISNPISALETRFEPELLTQIETFLSKSNKSEWEKHIVQHSSNNHSIEYINYLWGNFYLAQGELQKSLAAFAKISTSFKWEYESYDSPKDKYQGFTGISDKIFGYNQIECFNCPSEQVMKNDFSAQFPFIKRMMNKKELVETLIQLQESAKQDNENGAKANYLLGNFFYNVSLTGYYRHILRFDLTNGANWSKFSSWEESPKDIYNGVYFKYYWRFIHYDNQTGIAGDYLKKAYEQTNDAELKARIAFALSKFNRDSYWTVGKYEERIDFSEKYFAELVKYKDTRFYDEVKTHCKYFEYYVNNVVKD